MNHTYNLKYELTKLGFHSVSKDGVYKYKDDDGIVYIAYWGSYQTNSGQFESICIDNSVTRKLSNVSSTVEGVRELFDSVKKLARRKLNLKSLIEE